MPNLSPEKNVKITVVSMIIKSVPEKRGSPEHRTSEKKGGIRRDVRADPTGRRNLISHIDFWEMKCYAQTK